jgi:peptidoglycan/xylan/chitin deacetylase (PgdA/CDA1 family)
MKQTLLHFLDRLDQIGSRTFIRLSPPQPALMVWVFHVLFKDEKAISKKEVFPFEQLRVDQLETFISTLQQKGHRFVTPQQIVDGLPREGFFHLLTFDDGYFNNSWALPVLEAYGVPAVFHIATGYVERPRSFWWDAHYRAKSAKGASIKEILAEQNQLKQLPFDEVEAFLIKKYGPSILEPVGDQDRPFSKDELVAFAQHPLVHLGNHTQDHAILPYYQENQIREQIRNAQQFLEELSGETPQVIAYPNGEFSPAIANIAKAEGLQLGLTGERKKYSLNRPIPRMTMGRVAIYGFRQIAGQVDTYRSDRSMKWL